MEANRVIKLFCHSKEQKINYRRLADKAGMKLTTFLLDAIEKGLADQVFIADNFCMDEAKEQIARARAEADYYRDQLTECVELRDGFNELLNLYEKDRVERPTVEIKLLKSFLENGKLTAQQIKDLDLAYASDQLVELEAAGLIKSTGRGGYQWK